MDEVNVRILARARWHLLVTNAVVECCANKQRARQPWVLAGGHNFETLQARRYSTPPRRKPTNRRGPAGTAPNRRRPNMATKRRGSGDHPPGHPSFAGRPRKESRSRKSSLERLACTNLLIQPQLPAPCPSWGLPRDHVIFAPRSKHIVLYIYYIDRDGYSPWACGWLPTW